MNVVEKVNQILKQANISKVNLAKYLGVSRQMIYNYLSSILTLIKLISLFETVFASWRKTLITSNHNVTGAIL